MKKNVMKQLISLLINVFICLSAWGGDGGLVVGPLAAVGSPVVVAVVVDVPVPVEHQTVLTHLLRQAPSTVY